jgi:hypothetical protein
MRFRLPEWDVPMPDALVAYWTAWNSSELDRVGELLRRAVTDDVVWNDPRDSYDGIAELERAIVAWRTTKPEHAFTIVSEIDCQHNRLRYRWEMGRNGRTLMEGLDIATLAPSGLIERVDGFFGDPTPLKHDGSGVPAALQTR